MNFIPILSTLVTFVFAHSVFRRYQKKRSQHLLLWAFGLLLFGLGTLCEVILVFRFNALVLKLWYLTGAMLTAAWLGQGSFQLLIRKGKWATNMVFALGVFSLLALILVAMALVTSEQVNSNVASTASEQYKTILTRGGLTIILTILLNVYGTLGLVGGAAYSAFLFWRKKALAGRMFGNIFYRHRCAFPGNGRYFR